MRKELFFYKRDNTSEEILKSFSKEEQRTLKSFGEKILISASEIRSKEAIRELVRFREMVGKNLNKITHQDLSYFLREVKSSSLSDNFKNKIKGFIQRFLKWNYKDWSERFNNFEDIHFNSDATRKNPITPQDVLTKKQMDKILETEKNLFWKAFFVTQYEGAFRTGEVRKLKWSDVKFKDDNFVDVKVSSKKNKNGVAKYRELPLKESTKFLKALKIQQKAGMIKTDWVFPSPLNPNKHISKSVNLWFNGLTKKALGKPVTNYLLRHTRGTELARLVHEGKISKQLALKFMGHSERMFDKVYSHVSDGFLKDQMKNQIYDFEYLPEEKKHELEIEIDILKKAFHKLRSVLDEDSNKKLQEALILRKP